MIQTCKESKKRKSVQQTNDVYLFETSITETFSVLMTIPIHFFRNPESGIARSKDCACVSQRSWGNHISVKNQNKNKNERWFPGLFQPWNLIRIPPLYYSIYTAAAGLPTVAVTSGMAAPVPDRSVVLALGFLV